MSIPQDYQVYYTVSIVPVLIERVKKGEFDKKLPLILSLSRDKKLRQAAEERVAALAG